MIGPFDIADRCAIARRWRCYIYTNWGNTSLDCCRRNDETLAARLNVRPPDAGRPGGCKLPADGLNLAELAGEGVEPDPIFGHRIEDGGATVASNGRFSAHENRIVLGK